MNQAQNNARCEPSYTDNLKQRLWWLKLNRQKSKRNKGDPNAKHPMAHTLYASEFVLHF